MIGTTLSHYRTLDRLGEGGMGVVYRARDERLGRDVALKVLPPGSLSDETARRRFRREALSLSKLNHPNIATVHDFDTAGGVDFLVMELVVGETLEERLRAGPLSEREIARLGEQMAEGLAAAHAEGVIHRDVKPSNVRITAGGRVKILDFGLARTLRPVGGVPGGVATSTVSGDHAVSGTLPYMAPEQLRDEGVDARSDIWALGAVLYEMATGRRAFPEVVAARVIESILVGSPVAPRAVHGRVSAELERIVLKCLEKEPDHRYHAAAEVAVDLRRLGAPSGVAVAPAARRRARARSWVAAGAAVAAVALVGALVLDLGGLRSRLMPGPPGIPSLVVLPLANLTGDAGQDFFADGMTDELITRLTQVSALRVISRASAMQYRGTKKPLREVARELGVRMVVEGSVQRSGDRVRVSAQLIDAASDRNLWARSFEQETANILALQSQLASAIVEHLRAKVTPEEVQRLATSRAVSPEAHALVLKARYALFGFMAGGFKEARGLFTEALRIDPGYAAAHAGLATCYLALSSQVLPPREAMPRARAEAKVALALDSTSAEARAALGYVTAFYDWDWKAAEPLLRANVEAFPGSAESHSTYGYYLLVHGRFEEALRHLRRARELDPLNAYASVQTLWPLYEGRRYDDAIREAKSIIAVAPDQPPPYSILGQAHLQKKQWEPGVAAIEKWNQLSGEEFSWGQAWLGYAYGVAGERAKALQALERVRERARTGFFPAYGFAILHLGLGDKEEALRWLERCFEDRSEDLVFIKVEPALDPLRSDPRFQRLLERMGFASGLTRPGGADSVR